MKVKLWGVRGSIPVAGPETDYYGGQTSCMSLTEEGHQLIFDGGSGIQRLILHQTLPTSRIDILLTHLHMDHIQGLGFFKPLFDPSKEIHIWGPKNSAKPLQWRLSRYLSPPLFPVLIRDLPSKVIFHEIEKNTFDIGPFTIQSNYIIHPGPTLGYRIKGKRSTVTYIPDHEPALSKNGHLNSVKWLSGYDLARETDLLLHDGQFTHDEYQKKKGRGQSSIFDAGLFASLVEARYVLFTHHEPARTDIQINDMLNEFRSATDYDYKYEMAREGMEIDIS